MVETSDFSTQALPVADYRQCIVQSVQENQVTILVAETGAGKSTQVPQYLVEYGYRKVVVTQPRIIAARNLSLRVREEWTDRHGPEEEYVVGYRTSHERDDQDNTVILYCTDGLQLVREVTGAGIQTDQILILDEIHEWNQNMEVLVAWAKKRCQEEPNFKVVVMSATIDAESLAAYFQSGPPIMVPGRGHHITMRHADDLVPEILDNLENGPRNILVFLPGKAEIESVAARIWNATEERGIPIIPLHSQLEAEAQQLAFVSYPYGKVILSTNIAQTSVTIDDIDLVIDSGLERRIEIESGVEGLFIAEASRSDCLQRAGRAGRTKDGDYILASLDHLPCTDLESRPPYAIPEILRTHLDRLVLRLASAGLDIEGLEFFHTPGEEAIQQAKTTLTNLGAMTENGGVTDIGYRMERFPVESRYARMLVEAESLPDSTRLKLGAVIAIQEVGGIVRNGTRSTGWLQFCEQTSSDLLAQYDVYRAVPGIDPEELEDLGIIPKNVAKATETFERLCPELGLQEEPLLPLTPLEERNLRRCIVAGQIDQISLIGVDGLSQNLSGGMKREVSGGTVVARTGLVVGTPFNLEIPTARGLETLYLFQDLTRINPQWLPALAPELFKAKAGKIIYDNASGTLSEQWLLVYRGHTVKGARVPVLDRTPQNIRLFSELYGTWIYERLEEDRRERQRATHQRIAPVSPARVKERVRIFTGGALSLHELSEKQCVSLRMLMDIRTFRKIRTLSSNMNRTAKHRKQRRRGK